MLARSMAAALLALLLAGAGCPKGDDVKSPATRSTDLRPARDPDIAVQEELDAARRAGTVAAYDLFLARQGDHPLAQVARRERARLGAPTAR
jgi:hypothetical protein